MNRDMLMAGLEKFSEPTMDPSQVAYRHDTPGKGGRVFSTLLTWHEVAAAAVAYIQALEKAEWFAKLPENEQWQALQREASLAHTAERKADRLFELNDIQAAEIRRLQKELDAVMSASRV